MSQKKKMRFDDAMAIAATAFLGETDQGGEPYVLHLIRVAMSIRIRFRGHPDKDKLMQVAILHDLVEDIPVWTLERLLEHGFDPEVVAAIDAISKRDDEEYVEYIIRVALNAFAREVKKDDLKDNSDLTRLKGVRPKDLIRVQKYTIAYAFLDNKISIDEMKENITALPTAKKKEETPKKEE